ncbi:MAG: aminopeptidase P N-terminal domain-containing protein [Bacteroidota bacterium]
MNVVKIISISAILVCTFLKAQAQAPGVTFPYERYETTGISVQKYKARRNNVLKNMPPNSVALVFAADVRNRQNDVDYEYRQNSNLWYLSGMPDANTVLMLAPNGIEIDGKVFKEIMFVPERNMATEVWSGVRMGTRETETELGFEKAINRSGFLKTLESALAKTDTLFVANWPTAMVRKPVSGKITMVEKEEKEFLKEKFPNLVVKTLNILAQMREVKDDEEIALMQTAMDITAEGFKKTMAAARPGMAEYQLEAIMEFAFKNLGAEDVGYASIVGSGPNPCILHYTSNRRITKEGELVLADCGAEYRGYTADITRTFPMNGKFSPEQLLIYNIVLEAQDSGIAACRAGNAFKAPHQAAVSVVTRELLKLGIIKEAAEMKYYFMHGTSHYLGLDVHDAGTGGPLKENTVLTVEPGIYIPAGSPCDKKWWNIGVRIEDDIRVTNGDPVNMSVKLARTAREIEQLMNSEGKAQLDPKLLHRD